MAQPTARPLKSQAETEEVEAAPTEEEDSAETLEESPPEPAPRPRPPSFKPVNFLLTFLFLLGLLMVVDAQTRNGIASGLSYMFGPLIGFGGHYVLLTMFVAAAIEMALTAIAYNYTTDWVKAAKTQKWSSAFRKVQMAALRSGKKDRVDALKPHQQTLTKLSSEMSIAQLKGMAVTWFLLIAIYTWVGIFIGCAANAAVSGGHYSAPPSGWDGICASSVIVNFGGSSVNLTSQAWLFPLWFLIFSLYTIPSSFVFRRLLKHYSLRRHAEQLAALPETAAGGAA